MKERGYDPLELSAAVERAVTRIRGRVEERRYYRFRPAKFYGGIFTADAVGCNLRCHFCWSHRYVVNLQEGDFYSPERVARIVEGGAWRAGFSRIRVSGAEPTIGRGHLLSLIDELEGSGLLFILETNGILLSDPSYAEEIAKRRIHVRVSIKGGSPETFHRITGAKKEGFELQLKALENLVDRGASVHASAVVSFSDEDELRALMDKLREISPSLVRNFEPELVVLYRGVRDRLRRAGIRPLIALTPEGKLVGLPKL